MTPEGQVKREIKEYLKVLKQKYHLWYHMPVQNGMGSPTLDFNPVILRGRVCAIEAKAPGEQPTARQEQTLNEIRFAGGDTFVIDGSLSSWKLFEDWVYEAIKPGAPIFKDYK